GKPVANVGWIFVLRAPVRGPASRRSMRDARKTTKRSATPLAPLAPPAATKATKAGKKSAAAASPPKAAKKAPAASAAPAAKAAKASAPAEEPDVEGPRPRRRRSTGRHEPINDQLVYLSFRSEEHTSELQSPYDL